MLKDEGGRREVLRQRYSLTLLEKRAVIAYKDRHPGLKRDDLVDFCLLKFNRPVSRASITKYVDNTTWRFTGVNLSLRLFKKKKKKHL